MTTPGRQDGPQSASRFSGDVLFAGLYILFTARIPIYGFVRHRWYFPNDVFLFCVLSGLTIPLALSRRYGAVIQIVLQVVIIAVYASSYGVPTGLAPIVAMVMTGYCAFRLMNLVGPPMLRRSR